MSSFYIELDKNKTLFQINQVWTKDLVLETFSLKNKNLNLLIDKNKKTLLDYIFSNSDTELFDMALKLNINTKTINDVFDNDHFYVEIINWYLYILRYNFSSKIAQVYIKKMNKKTLNEFLSDVVTDLTQYEMLLKQMNLDKNSTNQLLYLKFLVKMLLEYQADYFYKNEHDLNSVLKACSASSFFLLDLFVDYGLDIDFIDTDGFSVRKFLEQQDQNLLFKLEKSINLKKLNLV